MEAVHYTLALFAVGQGAKGLVVARCARVSGSGQRVGAALGTLASLATNRYIAGQLFGVTPRDPVAIVAAPSVLGIVTMAAAFLPARQASRIDPVRALRAE